MFVVWLFGISRSKIQMNIKNNRCSFEMAPIMMSMMKSSNPILISGIVKFELETRRSHRLQPCFVEMFVGNDEVSRTKSMGIAKGMWTKA